MAGQWATVTATLNDGSHTNVSFVLSTSDYSSALTTAQNAVHMAGGFWTNSSAAGIMDTFYPASSILYLRIS